MNNLIIGITGASGSIYAKRLLQVLSEKNMNLHVIITQAAYLVLQHELDWQLTDDIKQNESYLQALFDTASLTLYDNNDIGACIASGSFPIDGMVIIPASMGSIGAIAHAQSSNLLERSADVTIKERRNLIVMPRETPMHQIHLENLLILSKLQACIIPAMPAFYQRPKTIDDLVDFLVARVLDHLNITHGLATPWSNEQIERL